MSYGTPVGPGVDRSDGVKGGTQDGSHPSGGRPRSGPEGLGPQRPQDRQQERSRKLGWGPDPRDLSTHVPGPETPDPRTSSVLPFLAGTPDSGSGVDSVSGRDNPRTPESMTPPSSGPTRPSSGPVPTFPGSTGCVSDRHSSPRTGVPGHQSCVNKWFSVPPTPVTPTLSRAPRVRTPSRWSGTKGPSLAHRCGVPIKTSHLRPGVMAVP